MKCKLGEFANVIMGQSPKSEFYNTEEIGMPFLQGNRTFGLKYPYFDTYTTKITKEAQAGDVIMSVRAPVGDLNIAPVNVCLGRGVCSLRAKNNNQSYLFYLLRFYMQDLLNKESGTVFGSVNRNDIQNLEINIPSGNTQKQIASILSALDNKIELNNRINENLELQAQAIFKSWFVDFEPFGGVMPENWKIGSLSDIADVLSGKRPPMKQNNKTEDVDIPLVGAAAIMGYTNKFNHDDKILVIGRVGTHGIVQRFDYPCWTSDNTLVIKSNCYEYIYQILKLIDYKAINRGSTQPLITQGDLKKTEIIIPSKECLQKYEDVVGSLMYRYSQNRIENEKLALLRDTLLPKLMNGEIDVSEVKI